MSKSSFPLFLASSSSAEEKKKTVYKRLDKTNLTEVQKEIMKTNFELEKERRVNSDYMTFQTDISEKMRRVVVDWMTGVQKRLRLHSGTKILAISIMDRFLNLRQCPRNMLQLISAVCLQIADKFKETHNAGVDDYAYMFCQTYTIKSINRAELIVLESLGYKIRHPTSFYFLHVFWQQLDNASHDLLHLAQYFTELSLMELSFYNYLSSEVAFSALYLANKLTGFKANLKPIRQITIYSGRNSSRCIRELTKCLQTYGKSDSPYPEVFNNHRAKLPAFEFPEDN